MLNPPLTYQSGYVAQAIAPPQPESAVPAAFGRLGASVDGLTHAVMNLAERLEAGGVLRPSAPTTQANGGAAPSCGCPMADGIAGHQARVSICVERLLDLAQRLEL
jgi:hypothetical protein